MFCTLPSQQTAPKRSTKVPLYSQIGRQLCRQTGMQTDRQTDRKTDKQTSKVEIMRPLLKLKVLNTFLIGL